MLKFLRPVPQLVEALEVGEKAIRDSGKLEKWGSTIYDQSSRLLHIFVYIMKLASFTIPLLEHFWQENNGFGSKKFVKS